MEAAEHTVREERARAADCRGSPRDREGNSGGVMQNLGEYHQHFS